ncbi:MAG: DUF885 domain-containing protein [Saprospiraceae bacterium]|nr:DUF885 domain-containing protein [Saprospiraceae bacterium]
MRYGFLLLFSAILFYSCGKKPGEPTQSPLEKLADDYWNYKLANDPFTAAYAGEINDSLLFPDLSSASLKLTHLQDSVFFERLQSISRAELNVDDVIMYDMMDLELSNSLSGYAFGDQYFTFKGDESFLSAFSYLIESLPFEKKGDYENYIQRLRAFPDYLFQNISLMDQGLKQGVYHPALLVENFHGGLQPFLLNDPVKHPFYAPFNQMEQSMEGDENLKTEGFQVIQNEILPAFQKLEKFVVEVYLPKAERAPGVSNLPEGKAYYENKVAYFTTLDISPDEVFEIGQQEVTRIKAEMDSLIATTGFKGDFAAFIQFLRTDPQFYPTSGEALLAYASRLSKVIDGKLPAYFNTLPRLPYGVIPVPDEIAPYYTAGRYSPGSLLNHKAGNYLVNTYKLESRPLYAFPALTLHEAVPGHHLQISLAQEMPDQHPLLQNTYLSAFGEGWALYCEWLGKEMGVYATPYDEFGRLTYEMWRACRLVVDVGIHYKGWSRQEAFDFLANHTALSLHEVGTEIDRYIGWPGQALSYKMGELKIRKLRKKAEESLKEKFDLRAFHDLILSKGSVPLTTMESMVDNWIQMQN